MVPNSHACFATRSVEKFREITPLGRKVIDAHTLNFGPIFKFCFLQIVGGTSRLVQVSCTSLLTVCHHRNDRNDQLSCRENSENISSVVYLGKR